MLFIACCWTEHSRTMFEGILWIPNHLGPLNRETPPEGELFWSNLLNFRWNTVNKNTSRTNKTQNSFCTGLVIYHIWYPYIHIYIYIHIYRNIYIYIYISIYIIIWYIYLSIHNIHMIMWSCPLCPPFWSSRGSEGCQRLHPAGELSQRSPLCVSSYDYINGGIPIAEWLG